MGKVDTLCSTSSKAKTQSTTDQTIIGSVKKPHHKSMGKMVTIPQEEMHNISQANQITRPMKKLHVNGLVLENRHWIYNTKQQRGKNTIQH